MEKPKGRGKHRIHVENDIIRRREREFNYEKMWSGTAKYFEHWDKANSKFDSWTSPRYYEDNNKLMSEIKTKRDKEEFLVKRKEKLRKLLEEEQKTYDIELMVHKNRNLIDKPSTSKMDDIPLTVLKEVNVGLKVQEENRRRREAELKLYHQWRKNNPLVRQYEIKYGCRDLKLSWLDQQIEKRMQKEKEEEETRRILKENEEKLKIEKEKEEQFTKYAEEKRQQLRRCLEQQMEELRKRQQVSENLRKKEAEETKNRMLIAEIEEKRILEERLRREKECALFNIKQHKLKLKQKAHDIQENLEQEKSLIARLKEIELETIVTEEQKRKEIKEGLSEFLSIVKEQQALERQRQKYLDFLFDSEAKAVYEQQTQIWRQEELARKNLVKQVMETIQQQIEENIRKNKEEQTQLLAEREEMARKIEEYDRELEELNKEEKQRQIETQKVREDDIKVRNARKKQQDNLKMKEIEMELEKIQKQEKKLQQEIMEMQKKQGPITRPRSSRLFF
ncbi:trichoplein keratin filament-binding protein [Leptinotarsa decemlineata]|uniref:trichoplein keratin filament-binding protein n=1 Tax=Leptinotarsa decemlineata TaxID=7539 RepID=UPI003D305F25